MGGKGRDRMVYQNSSGDWSNKRNDAGKASSVHATQKAAEDAARKMLGNQGGGELIIKGLNGQIRSKDTIEPGNESSVKDKEH